VTAPASITPRTKLSHRGRASDFGPHAHAGARSPGAQPWPAQRDPHRQRQGVPRQAMVTWAHERGVQLRLIQPGSPTRTPTSSLSTASCAMSASTSTGSRIHFTRGP
jgi:hypothetical protein